MWRKFIVISALILVIDQITKFVADKYLVLSHSIPVLGNFFQLTLVKNPYGVWGIKVFAVLPIVMALTIILLIIVFHKTKLLQLSLICGGALGNLIDRIRFGTVTDFLDFGIKNLRWPVFNIADTGITIGILLLIMQSITKKGGK